MKTLLCSTLAFLLVCSIVADEKKPDPYAELFSFSEKITLDAKQKEALAELRKEYEKQLVNIVDSPSDAIKNYRHQLMREVTIKKNAILTASQREALNIKAIIPACVQEKALNDAKIWDVVHLEKHFTIQSRSYSPEGQVVTFVVITKKKWTEQERRVDAEIWNNGKVKALFYNKDEELVAALSCPTPGIGRNDGQRMYLGINRTEIRLAEKEAEEGLMRYRIKIDLAPSFIGEFHFTNINKAATVKLVYPELKE